MPLRSRTKRVAAGVALAAALTAGTTAPRIANAATLVDTAGATWSMNPAIVGVSDTVTVTLTNSASSTEEIGSAQLTFNTLPSTAVQVVPGSLPVDWSAQVLAGTPAVVRLTSIDEDDFILPGHTLTVQIKLTPTAPGTLTIAPGAKTSNNYSGTGNDFTLGGSSGLSITVVAPTLEFAQQPSKTIGQSLPGATPPYFTDFCNPVSVQLYNGATPLAVSGIAVTVTYAGSANPGLYFGTSAAGTAGVTVSTDSSGLATYGTCSSGLAATVVGLSFSLQASSPVAAAPVTSTSFQVLQSCVGSCTTDNSSTTTGTTGQVSASDSGVFQIFTSFGQGVTLSCDVAVTAPGTPVDPLFALTQSTAGSVSGTLTMVFPKSVVNSLSDNGTPHMAACAGALKPFLRQGNPATGQPWPGSTAYPYQGLLYNCTDPTYVSQANNFPLQMCVQSRAKVGNGAERIVVFASNLSDPSFW